MRKETLAAGGASALGKTRRGFCMSKYSIGINKKWCKSCGICIDFCPKNVLGFDEDGKVTLVNEEDCIGCEMYERRCPDYAIKVEGKAK